MYNFTIENDMAFGFYPLTKEEVKKTRLLCDACVGKNLYTEEELLQSIEAEDRFFYLLKTDKGETIGYIYCYLTDVESMAKFAKIDPNLLGSVYHGDKRKIGKIQSVGLKKDYRGMGLAAQMIRFTLKKFAEISIEAVFIVCWKPGGIVPLDKALQNCNFTHLTEAKRVWYDDIDLICPYCQSRCVCDAEVYYKILDKETCNEA